MNTFTRLSNKFHTGVRWSFTGSIIYEAIKAVHNFFLFSLMDNATYGLLGSTFSVVYFSSKLADLGASSSLPPFFHQITQNKQSFRYNILKYYLLPHLPLIFLVAIGTIAIYLNNFTPSRSSTLFIIIPLIISLESVRYFLRLFLHSAFKSKAVVIIEVSLFVLFIALVWLPHLILKTPLTITTILIPHVIDSFLCVTLFLMVLLKFYKKLPEGENVPIRRNRIIITKAISYTLRISRDIFTSNFLTPLLALKCGLGQAGIFYLTTVLVNAIQATIKMSIHYPAHGVFSNLKESTHLTKKAAFSMLSQKLTKLITPLIIFFTINYQLLFGPHTKNPLIIAFIFLFISLIDSFFILYEQFYIIEESSMRLLLFKLLECTLFYFFVIKSPSTTLITLIIIVASIKLLSFTLTTLNAFTRWRLTPAIKPNFKSIFIWIIISLLFRIIPR